MTDMPKIPRALKRRIYNKHAKRVTRSMQDPRRIRLVCTGTSKRPHNKSRLVDIWIDLATGKYIVDDDMSYGNPDNATSMKRHERRPKYQAAATPDTEGRTEFAAYRLLMETMADLDMAPSHRADHIRCPRCQFTAQHSPEKLTQLFMALALQGAREFDVSTIPN